MTLIEGTLPNAFTLVSVISDLSLSLPKEEIDLSFWQEITGKLRHFSGGNLIECKRSIPLSGLGDIEVSVVIEETSNWPVRLKNITAFDLMSQQSPDEPTYVSLMNLSQWMRALLGEHVVEHGVAPKLWILINGKGEIVAMS